MWIPYNLKRNSCLSNLTFTGHQVGVLLRLFGLWKLLKTMELNISTRHYRGSKEYFPPQEQVCDLLYVQYNTMQQYLYLIIYALIDNSIPFRTPCMAWLIKGQRVIWTVFCRSSSWLRTSERLWKGLGIYIFWLSPPLNTMITI